MLRAENCLPALAGARRTDHGQRPRRPLARSSRRDYGGGQGVRVFRAEDSLPPRQKRGELVASGGRVARPPGPVGEFVASGQRVRVVGAEDSLPR